MFAQRTWVKETGDRSVPQLDGKKLGAHDVGFCQNLPNDLSKAMNFCELWWCMCVPVCVYAHCVEIYTVHINVEARD